MKKRSKISFLPINMFWCINDFCTAFFVCSFFFTNTQSLIIGILHYLNNIRNQVDLDYLKDKNDLK